MKYTNEICCACGRSFEEKDDVVVCPVCGAPHHRECYNKAGGCVKECLHESGFEWKSSRYDEEISQSKVCPVCSTVMDKSVERCPKCGVSESGAVRNPGARLSDFPTDEEGVPYLDDIIEQRVVAIAPGITPEQRMEKLCGHNIDQTVAFIGNNAKAYVEKFRKYEQTGKRGFNWGAALFGPVWLFYRKLYRMGAVYLSLYISGAVLATSSATAIMTKWGFAFEDPTLMTETMLMEYLSDSWVLFMVAGALLLINLFLGFQGNLFYWRSCKEGLDKLDEIRATGTNADALRFYIKKSSTSYIAGFAAFMAYEFLPSLIFNYFYQL